MRYSLPEQNNNSSSGSLASMIDIIFLLIIFFVVTASFDREQIDSSVTLPSVDSGVAVKTLPPERIVVNVSEDGSVKIGYHAIQPDRVEFEVGAALSELTGNKKVIVVVNGAAKVKHKYVSNVLEAAAAAGFDQVRISAVIKAKE